MTEVMESILEMDKYTEDQVEVLARLERKVKEFRHAIYNLKSSLNEATAFLDEGGRARNNPVNGQEAIAAAVLQSQVMMLVDALLDEDVDEEDIDLVLREAR